MDAEEVSLALTVSCVPPIVWLFCGLLFSVSKTTWSVFLQREKSSFAKTEPEVVDTFNNPFVSFIIKTLVDIWLLIVELTLNSTRVLLTNLPFFIIFFLSSFGSIIILRNGPEIIFIVDTAYEAVRPNFGETVLHVLNFSRVVFALVVGVWNALIDILLIPLKILFDSAFRCGGSEFIRQVAGAGADVVRNLAEAMAGFFSTWKRENIFDVDVTSLTTSIRHFLVVFVDVINCSCETISVPTTRAIAYPLWSNTTDVFVNNATRVVMKGFQIPYEAMTTAKTSFEPLFELLLNESTGVFATGAILGNEHLQAITHLVQIDMEKSDRFDAPPAFSLLHHFSAAVTEMIRGVIKTTSAIPDLMGSNPKTVAAVVHDVTTTYHFKHHVNMFFDVLFIEIFAVLHDSWRDYGVVFSTSTRAVTETIETVYNFTLDTAVGVQASEHRNPVKRNVVGGSVKDCTTAIGFSENVVDKIRFAFLAAADRYSNRVVPLQDKALREFRTVLGVRLLAVALGESMYTTGLILVRALESYAKMATYAMDASLRFQPVSSFCIDAFQAPVWEKIDDLLTSLPNLITSNLNVEETNDSGYANLVCARSTHVNHVYSGSLKAYVFASTACRTQFMGTNTFPKCSYRHENKEEQSRLCSKLMAYADYNTNPMCNTGDVLIEALRSWVMALRTLYEYQTGMIIGIWNCIADAEDNDFSSCGGKLGGEFVPSKTAFDLVECQINELVYRVMVAFVSIWTPLFDTIYYRIEYPLDGYYAYGADDVMHVQARPIEAAFTTLLTAFGGIFTYPVHVFAECGRDLTSMFGELVNGVFDPTKFFEYRYKIITNALRAIVLFFRDVLVALVQFARALDTISYYQQRDQQRGPNRVEEFPDPTQTTSGFKDFQKAVGTIVGLMQDIAELFTEAFIRGVEMFFDIISFSPE